MPVSRDLISHIPFRTVGMAAYNTAHTGDSNGGVVFPRAARNCPARKFSQVKFVAINIATLLRDWRVDPVPVRVNENVYDVRTRVMDLTETDCGTVLLLQMMHPERESLTWSKRSG